jgi:hypothetical protein
MNNINPFFQASQKNGTSFGDNNGTWTTTLKQPLEIMEGDELVLNKAIIDSRASSSGNIILEQDLTIKFDFYYYLLNAYGSNNFTNYLNANPADPITGPDWGQDRINYRPFVLQVPNGGALSHQNLEEIYCQCNPTGRQGREGDQFGMTLAYTDLNNHQHQVHNLLTFTKGVDGSPTWWWSRGENQPIRCLSGTFRIVYDSFTNGEIDEFNIDKSTIKVDLSAPSGSASIYTPYTASQSITIDAGTYSPGDLAERITAEADAISTTTELQRKEPTGGNMFLQSTGSSFYNHPSTGLFAKNAIWVDAFDGNYAFKLQPSGNISAGPPPTPPNDIYFGTDNFSLEYDEGLEKFKFSYLNMSLYYNNKQSIKFVNQSSATLMLQNKYSGIIIKSIQSTYADGTTKPLFFGNTGEIGFRSDLIPAGYDTTNSTATGLSSTFMIFKDPTNPSSIQDLRDGVSMTGALTGLTSAVNKNGATDFITLPDFSVAPFINPIAAPQQNEIYAEGNYNVSNVSFGYYLISVEGIPTSINSGVDLKQNIIGIVSRYYENDNYTNGSNDDAIVYKHIGMPMTIQGLKVRILKPDYTPATNLGDDNTIFLTLQRSPSNIPALLELQAQEEQKKDSYKK